MTIAASCDVVVDCTDNFPTRLLINAACVAAYTRRCAMSNRPKSRHRSRPIGSIRGAALLGACVLAAPESALAVLLVYEPFDYTEGTVLDGTPATGQNLSGNFAALDPAPQQQLTVTSPSLDYGGLDLAPAASGLRISDTLGVTAAGASVSLAQPIGIAPGEALYWSALLTLDDRLNGNHFANITRPTTPSRTATPCC